MNIIIDEVRTFLSEGNLSSKQLAKNIVNDPNLKIISLYYCEEKKETLLLQSSRIPVNNDFITIDANGFLQCYDFLGSISKS